MKTISHNKLLHHSNQTIQPSIKNLALFFSRGTNRSLLIETLFNYIIHPLLITTGFRPFAECLGHSAKFRLHSAKVLLNAKKHSAKRSTRQKCKSEKIQENRKKIYWGGMHSQLVTHPMGCTFFSNFL
jgi:hypothetical protein